MSHCGGEPAEDEVGHDGDFYNRLDIGRSDVALRVRNPRRNDNRLTGFGDEFSPVEGEAGFAGDNGEAFFLLRVDVLGDDAPGHSAPVEAHEISVVVLGYSRVLNLFAGGRVEKRSESARVAIGFAESHGVCTPSRTVFGCRGRRSPRRLVRRGHSATWLSLASVGASVMVMLASIGSGTR